MDLENELALVTGAASGIGRAAAIGLAREGATVVAVDRDADGLAATVATPEEIADAVLFFASARAAYVTGQVLSVSGGLTMAG